jgi:ABC-type cobalt transport system, ATPase component
MSSDLFNNHIFDDRRIIIKFINLSWKYENSSKYAIRNINLEIRKGDVILITGPSGSGKTTICRCINGLIPHFYRGEQDGDVYVNELNTKDYDIPVLSTTVGFLFDTPSNQLFCSTVEEEIAFGLENLCLPPIEIRKKVKEGLKFSRLIGNETKSPHSLSGGQQQSLALASILVMQPDILVLMNLQLT